MKKKVLIIEDEMAIRSALVDKFTREGFIVKYAQNGQEGLNAALKTHPDLILLDIVMPVMDGLTMLSELRKDDWGKSASVIFLTNLSDATSVMASLNRGGEAYLVKSDWKISDIVEMVKGKLSDKKLKQ